MTVVLVQRNPETEAIWGPLVDALGRDDVVRLSPPGFGAPLPDDFPATYLAYRDWLEGELASFAEPVDIVGHDWGGGHVVNVVMHRPELVRSWASDAVGLFDPEYVWHDLAQVWQTMDIATSIAAAQGPEMGRAILLLYRSAAQPAMTEAGHGIGKCRGSTGNFTTGNRGPIHWVRRPPTPGCGPSRSSDRGARRARALVDGAGSRARHGRSYPLLAIAWLNPLRSWLPSGGSNSREPVRFSRGKVGATGRGLRAGRLIRWHQHRCLIAETLSHRDTLRDLR
jgi:pimeloyl-ACP methyl ester carboxylesterase